MILEKLARKIAVEVASPDEAYSIAVESHKNDNVVLRADDFTDIYLVVTQMC